MTLDHSALWSMYASLEELRGKIGHVLKCAIQMSKVAWSNVIAKRCQRNCSRGWASIHRRSGLVVGPCSEEVWYACRVWGDSRMVLALCCMLTVVNGACCLGAAFESA